MIAANKNNELYSEVRIPVPWGYMAGRWYGDQLQQPILALHGWLENCGTFAKLAPLLTAHASLLCVDLPGHGLSSHLPPGILYTNIDYVRCILRIMQAYKWSKVTLLGHSMGGSVVFNFAGLYPERVEKIISIDVVKVQYFEPEQFGSYWEYVVEKSLIQHSMNEPPCYSFEECEHMLYEGSQHSIALENCKYILERNISRSQKYPNKYYFSRDNRVKYLVEDNPHPQVVNEMGRRISRIPIPYIVIKGGASTNITEHSDEIIALLKEKNPFFEMHEVPGGTHHFHLNDPQPVADLIIEFLKKHEKKPAGQEGKDGRAKL